jgi:hypothetical protein
MSDTNDQNNLPKFINPEIAHSGDTQTDKIRYISRKRKRALVKRVGAKVAIRKLDNNTRMTIMDEDEDEANESKSHKSGYTDEADQFTNKQGKLLLHLYISINLISINN